MGGGGSGGPRPLAGGQAQSAGRGDRRRALPLAEAPASGRAPGLRGARGHWPGRGPMAAAAAGGDWPGTGVGAGRYLSGAESLKMKEILNCYGSEPFLPKSKVFCHFQF